MSFERDARCKHGETNPGGSGGCSKCHEEEFGPPIEYVYTDQLRPEQKRYWRSMQWLTDWSIRGEGRTTLLALAFLQQADKHPGSEIELWDHYSADREQRRLMTDTVRMLITRMTAEEPEYFGARLFYLDPVGYTLTRIR